jgi:hypothetical protein
MASAAPRTAIPERESPSFFNDYPLPSSKSVEALGPGDAGPEVEANHWNGSAAEASSTEVTKGGKENVEDVEIFWRRFGCGLEFFGNAFGGSKGAGISWPRDAG